MPPRGGGDRRRGGRGFIARGGRERRRVRRGGGGGGGRRAGGGGARVEGEPRSRETWTPPTTRWTRRWRRFWSSKRARKRRARRKDGGDGGDGRGDARGSPAGTTEASATTEATAASKSPAEESAFVGGSGDRRLLADGGDLTRRSRATLARRARARARRTIRARATRLRRTIRARVALGVSRSETAAASFCRESLSSRRLDTDGYVVLVARVRNDRGRDKDASAIVVDRSASARTLFAKRKESVRRAPAALLLFVGARRRVGRLLAANFRRRVSSRGTTPCRGCNTPTCPRPGRNPRRAIFITSRQVDLRRPPPPAWRAVLTADLEWMPNAFRISISATMVSPSDLSCHSNR